jgi:hypothetical protein
MVARQVTAGDNCSVQISQLANKCDENDDDVDLDMDDDDVDDDHVHGDDDDDDKQFSNACTVRRKHWHRVNLWSTLNSCSCHFVE